MSLYWNKNFSIPWNRFDEDLDDIPLWAEESRWANMFPYQKKNMWRWHEHPNIFIKKTLNSEEMRIVVRELGKALFESGGRLPLYFNITWFSLNEDTGETEKKEIRYFTGTAGVMDNLKNCWLQSMPGTKKTVSSSLYTGLKGFDGDLYTYYANSKKRWLSEGVGR